MLSRAWWTFYREGMWRSPSCPRGWWWSLARVPQWLCPRCAKFRHGGPPGLKIQTGPAICRARIKDAGLMPSLGEAIAMYFVLDAWLCAMLGKILGRFDAGPTRFRAIPARPGLLEKVFHLYSVSWPETPSQVGHLGQVHSDPVLPYLINGMTLE